MLFIVLKAEPGSTGNWLAIYICAVNINASIVTVLRLYT